MNYTQVSYIIVLEDSPEYFWCEDRVAKKKLTKVESIDKRKSRNEVEFDDFDLIGDEYVQLKRQITYNKKVKYSWSAIDSAVKRVMINVFYAPPHSSEIPVKWFDDLIYLNHIPVFVIPDSRKRANLSTSEVDKRRKVEKEEDDIQRFLHSIGFRTGPSNSYIMIRKSSNCRLCDPTDEPTLMLPFVKLYKYFQYRDCSIEEVLIDDICLEHCLKLPSILNDSFDDWIENEKNHRQMVEDIEDPNWMCKESFCLEACCSVLCD